MDKKNSTKFTIQFNPRVSSHLKAIKILNSVQPRSKAQLIADALLLYNQTLGLIDVSTTDDVIINIPTKTPPKKVKPATTSIEKTFEKDDSITLDDYDDFDDDETNDNEYDNVFAQSLMSMGFTESED